MQFINAQTPSFDGILLVDKPSGPTSHDIVAQLRRRFRIEKVGHGGTLDPMATGLMIILLGKGTKISQTLMGFDKTYEGTLKLGVTTDSQDADGEITGEHDCTHVTRDQLEDAFSHFSGDIMQTPPMVSAIKKNGVPLYKLARKGQMVEREPRLIHLYWFKMLNFSPPFVDFTVRCTKGTYVRTLAADVGERLTCGAHLTALRRTRIGKLDIKDATPFDTLMTMAPEQMAPLVTPLTLARPLDWA